MARCGTASRKRARARIRGRDKQRAECCRQELTKHAPRSHDWILREPLLTNQQRSHTVVFNSIGELREDFLFSCCGFQQLKEEHIGGGSWGAQDAAHGASDNELVIRRSLQHREPSRTPLDRSGLLSPAPPRSFYSD